MQDEAKLYSKKKDENEKQKKPCCKLDKEEIFQVGVEQKNVQKPEKES